MARGTRAAAVRAAQRDVRPPHGGWRLSSPRGGARRRARARGHDSYSSRMARALEGTNVRDVEKRGRERARLRCGRQPWRRPPKKRPLSTSAKIRAPMIGLRLRARFIRFSVCEPPKSTDRAFFSTRTRHSLRLKVSHIREMGRSGDTFGVTLASARGSFRGEAASSLAADESRPSRRSRLVSVPRAAWTRARGFAAGRAERRPASFDAQTKRQGSRLADRPCAPRRRGPSGRDGKHGEAAGCLRGWRHATQAQGERRRYPDHEPGEPRAWICRARGCEAERAVPRACPSTGSASAP